MTAHGPYRVAARSADSPIRVWPGEPYPLGATWNGLGVNFSIFSEHATRVDLCLFDGPEATVESERIPLPEQTNMNWHGYVPDVRPGQLYGYRLHGPWDPAKGHRFNPNKVVLDPYAKAIARPVTWDDAMFGYTIGQPQADVVFDGRDSAPFAPLAAVVDAAFTWGDDRPPRTPWHETVIYEMHVRGFSKLQTRLPERIRGTYEALTTDTAISHLLKLGVTAVELMPVHHHSYDRHLVERGLTNYWGYNTLSFFAPNIRYAADRDADRHRARVQADGAGAARRRPRGHSRRRVQPHGGRQSPRARRCRCAASTTVRTTACWRRTRATISTSPGAATR